MNNRGNPLLSVIIPTRERAETLRYTLRTALDQRSPNFEVLVSDNFSQDNTAQVVKSFSDPRLRVINPGQRLSMSDHWDFALLHARGDYILFIGDDDGIVPGALDQLEASILRTRCLVYCWPRPIYNWPMDGKPANVVYLPPTTEPSEIDLEDLARLAASTGGWNRFIPCMYHSAVAKSIPDSIREKTGRVFHSTQPDVFMSMAIPVFADKAIDVGYHVSAAGQSEKANSGINQRAGRHEYFNEFIQEYGGYKIHPTLFPEIPLGLNLSPDSLLVAMDKFPEFYRGMKFNYDAMWAGLIRDNSIVYRYRFGALDVLQKRQQIQRYHPFRLSRFLFYLTFQQSLRLRARMLARVRTSPRLVQPPPDNIFDFVKILSDPKSIRHSVGGL